MTRDLYDILDALPDYDESNVTTVNRLSVAGNKRMAENMRARHRDPKFAKEHKERGRRHMRRMNRDPKFTEKRLQALRDVCDSEEFRNKMRQIALKRWAKARGE